MPTSPVSVVIAGMQSYIAACYEKRYKLAEQARVAPSARNVAERRELEECILKTERLQAEILAKRELLKSPKPTPLQAWVNRGCRRPSPPPLHRMPAQGSSHAQARRNPLITEPAAHFPGVRPPRPDSSPSIPSPTISDSRFDTLRATGLSPHRSPTASPKDGTEARVTWGSPSMDAKRSMVRQALIGSAHGQDIWGSPHGYLTSP